MAFVVEEYDDPNLVVRNSSTGEAYEFTVSKNGNVQLDSARSDLAEPRRTAIAYLARRKGAA
jgi:hypothetical protein